MVGNLGFIHECVSLFADGVGAPEGWSLLLGSKTMIEQFSLQDPSTSPCAFKLLILEVPSVFVQSVHGRSKENKYFPLFHGNKIPLKQSLLFSH